MARLRFQVWLDIRDMKPEDLAHKVGVSNQAVDRWLDYGIPRARVEAVAEALRIEPSELYRFVDADIAAELIDFSQDVGRKKNKKAAKKAAQEAAALEAQRRIEISKQQSTYGRALPNRTIFDERRVAIDRRRNRWKGIDQQCRRNNFERRDTSYSSKSNDWWLHVDYVNGQVTEALVTTASVNSLVKHTA